MYLFYLSIYISGLQNMILLQTAYRCAGKCIPKLSPKLPATVAGVALEPTRVNAVLFCGKKCHQNTFTPSVTALTIRR